MYYIYRYPTKEFRIARRETCHPAPLGAGEPVMVAYDRRDP